MLKINICLLSLIVLCVIYSCKKTYKLVPDKIVINEIMPVNFTVIADQNGQYNDWIELYNKSSSTIDLSGYFLSDSKDNYAKWEIPFNTSIQGRGYLIIWADKDTTQPGLHANFKLSSTGEDLYLSKPDHTLIDEVTYPGQTIELTYSRNPNGTGSFRWQKPTYDRSNN